MLFKVTGCAVALVIGAQVTYAQQRRGEASAGVPKVGVVQSIGCVERRSGNGPGGRGPRSEIDTWWLIRAAEAKATETTFFNATDVEEAKSVALGTNAYQLIGVADFLDAEGLLQEGQRSQFTTRETANASGQLREGRKVAVKGLFIDAGGQTRINLTQVISVSDTCQ
jgi:hypothetical protein